MRNSIQNPKIFVMQQIRDAIRFVVEDNSVLIIVAALSRGSPRFCRFYVFSGLDLNQFCRISIGFAGILAKSTTQIRLLCKIDHADPVIFHNYCCILKGFSVVLATVSSDLVLQESSGSGFVLQALLKRNFLSGSAKIDFAEIILFRIKNIP